MCEGDERTVLKAAHIESSAEIFLFFFESTRARRKKNFEKKRSE